MIADDLLRMVYVCYDIQPYMSLKKITASCDLLTCHYNDLQEKVQLFRMITEYRYHHLRYLEILYYSII